MGGDLSICFCDCLDKKQDLAEMMAGKNCGVMWGNLISSVILPFPIAMYEDPLDYVRKGKAAVDRKKNSLQAVLAYRCATFLIKMFGVKVRFIIPKNGNSLYLT